MKKRRLFYSSEYNKFVRFNRVSEHNRIPCKQKQQNVTSNKNHKWTLSTSSSSSTHTHTHARLLTKHPNSITRPIVCAWFLYIVFVRSFFCFLIYIFIAIVGIFGIADAAAAAFVVAIALCCHSRSAFSKISFISLVWFIIEVQYLISTLFFPRCMCLYVYRAGFSVHFSSFNSCGSVEYKSTACFSSLFSHSRCLFCLPVFLFLVAHRPKQYKNVAGGSTKMHTAYSNSAACRFTCHTDGCCIEIALCVIPFQSGDEFSALSLSLSRPFLFRFHVEKINVCSSKIAWKRSKIGDVGESTFWRI